MTRTAAVLAVVLALSSALVAGACGSGGAKSSGATSSTPTSAQLNGSITVFAASSLTDAFAKLGAGFQRVHPGRA